MIHWETITCKLSRWIVGEEDVLPIIEDAYEQALSLKMGSIIVLADDEPVRFWGRFLGTVRAGRTICLFNPKSVDNQWIEAKNTIKPSLIYHRDHCQILENGMNSYSEKILIPTGGTGGKLKWAIHTWESLSAAVEGLAEHLPGPLNSVAPLPLYHVSGFMPGLRALLTGGYVVYPQASLTEASVWPTLEGACVSLVPTQLIRLIEDANALSYLKKARIIFLGGASPHAGGGAEALARAREHHLPIVFTYGMTETAAMVAMSDVNDFLQGDVVVASPLPHVTLSVKPDLANPSLLHEGRICIQSKSLFQGYFPDLDPSLNLFETSDYGICDPKGGLLSVRRLDRVIVSGGEKIDLALLELILLNTGLLESVYIKGEPSVEWGTQAVVYYVIKNATPLTLDECHLMPYLDDLKQVIRNSLGGVFVPKRWVCLACLPIKENGKVDTLHTCLN